MFRRNAPLTGVICIALSIAVLALFMVTHSLAGGPPGGRAVVSWDGSCGTVFWATVCNPGSHTNWNPDIMPSSSDDVSANALVTLLGGVGDASTVSFPVGLNITNGGQLRVNGAGGTIQNLALTNSSVNVVTEGANLEISGNSTSNGGMVYGNGALVNTGTLTGLSLMVRNLSNQPATFVNTLGGQATLSTIPTEPGVSMVNANATLTLVPSSQTSGGAIASTGHGSFENTGTFITQHNGAAYSNFTIGCGMLQTDGEFIVQGASNATGTVLSGGALFSGGEILVNDNANLRFQTGVSGLYEFDGLSAINGNGNAFIQLGPFNGPDWRVLSDLNVNLTGTTGLMLDSGKLTLTGALTNAGNAWWKAMTIRKDAGAGGSAKFINSGPNFKINTQSSSNAVTLDAPFENSGTVTQTMGRLYLDDDSSFTNTGEYRALVSEIARQNAAYVNPFINSGVFSKPNDPATQDSIVSTVFRNETGGEIKVDKSMLSFYGDSLRLAGGGFTLAAPGVLRLTSGDSVAEPGTATTITGTGKMIVDFFGAAGYLLAESDAVVTSSLAGPQGGLWLKVGGHMGGPGLFISTGEFHWDDGSIGINGAGEFWNQAQTVISHGSDIEGPTASFVNDVGATVIQQPGNLLVDSGAVIHNRGMWQMSIADNDTSISDPTGTFINYGQGVVEVQFVSGDPGISDADFTVAFQNFGTFHAKNSAVTIISNSLDVVDGKLLRGTWIAEPFAQIYFPGILIDGVGGFLGGLGQVVVTGSSFGFPDFDLHENYGTVNATGPLNSTGPIDNHGNLNASPGPITTPGQINNGDQPGTTSILKYVNEYIAPGLAAGGGASGFVCAAFNNYANGVIRPGGYAAPGPFHIAGNFNQFNGGIIDIELAGTLPVDGHDQLMVDGNVALDGILRVHVLPPYAPAPGQQFTIITASNGTISGTFDQVVGYGQYTVAYAPNAVTLTVVTPPTPGDINGDGLVNVTDLLAIIMGWGVCPAQPAFCAADLNSDGLVNVTDLLSVISNWS